MTSYKVSRKYALSASQGSSARTHGKMEVFHSTANVGASAANNAAFEKRTWYSNGAYVHAIVGDGIVYIVGDEGYQAWGAGPTANALAPVQVEMEESASRAKQLRIYNTMIAYLRDRAKAHGIPLTFDAPGNAGIKSHRWISQTFGETDHTDPWAPLGRIGKTKADVAADLKAGVKISATSKVASKVSRGTAKAKTVVKKLAAAKAVTVTYELHQLGGGWLGEVTNFNNQSSDGYAGNPNHKHDLLTVRVSHGSVRYRVHVVSGGWLGWVTKSNKQDTVNGCAGISGKAIDGVQVEFLTPAGESYQQAWYRAQTTARRGWLDPVCDVGTSMKGWTDSWAGFYGEPIDRLQIKVGTKSPY